MTDLKKDFRNTVERISSEWLHPQDAWLGKSASEVTTDTPGYLWARLKNGKAVRVYNGARVPATFDLHVEIGENRHHRKLWQIIRTLEDFDEPATGTGIGNHHLQHEFNGFDEVNVIRKQVVDFSCRRNYDTGLFIVREFGGVYPTSTGVVRVAPQDVDLSAYALTAGAQFASIESDSAGTLSVHLGTLAGSKLAINETYIATPSPGKCLLAYVLLYEGQSEIVDEEIFVPMAVVTQAIDAGTAIHSATASTPLDVDEFGFWSIAGAVLRKITLGNLKTLLRQYFDIRYSASKHSHDLNYSLTGHVHQTDLRYSQANHKHDLDYAQSGHTHTVGQYRELVWDVVGDDLDFLTDSGEALYELKDLE